MLLKDTENDWILRFGLKNKDGVNRNRTYLFVKKRK